MYLQSTCHSLHPGDWLGLFVEIQIIFGTVYTKFPSVTSLVYQCGEWRFRLIWDSVDDIPSIRDWLGLYMDIFGTVCTVQYYDPSDSARQIPCFFVPGLVYTCKIRLFLGQCT